MPNPSRRVPALVALSLALTMGFSFFATQSAHPQYAYPAAPVSAPASEPPALAICEDPDVDSLSVRDARLLMARAAAEARPQAPASEAAPAPATAAPVAQLPVVPPIVVAGVAGIVMPVNAPLTSPFGLRYHPILHVVKLHTGMDLGAACGTPVAAALPGVVTFAGVDRAYGGRVVIDHGMIGGHRIATTYSHLSALGVRVGQTVVGGAGIGLVGTTGFSTGCHLHVELLVDGSFVDPAPWFRNGTITTTTLGQVVPVEQVPDPIPEPEVPNQQTTQLLPEPPVVSASPSAAASGTPSGIPSATGSMTPGPSATQSTPTAGVSVTLSPSASTSASEPSTPSLGPSTPVPSSTASGATPLPATTSAPAPTSAPPSGPSASSLPSASASWLASGSASPPSASG